MLNIDVEKRMTAKGIIDYLEGKCKPKEYEKNTEKIALFGDVSAEKLNKFMGENHKGFDMFEKYLNDEFEHAMDDKREKKAKEDLTKVENIKNSLIKNAVKSIETFLKELEQRDKICDH
ncbi:hypothetical protein niasHT_024848 [Heterodera trifolii]|uniref:Uncharacterized protein n=1 Tax=Heterodera trifolii TaxID=157864 RepID=A0ABD2JWD6_9BILA